MKAHQLEKKLKTLRLDGMPDTLELRLQQAQTAELGYLVFLELLLEDEISRREQNALARRLHQARFAETKTLADFDFGFNPKIPAATIRDLATCRFVERKESVILCGPVGVGKSHIACALGYVAYQQGYHVLYTKTAHLLQNLGGGHADGTWDNRLRKYLKPDLLILDDFGLRELTPQQAEDLYELHLRTPQGWLNDRGIEPRAAGLVRLIPQPGPGRRCLGPAGEQCSSRPDARQELPTPAPP